ncbi:putative Diguanylate cyclase [Candidatus Nitrotoga sp. BS]|uniref:GGDEF domain-containing response regulator n=1 Tax=Candidatus Nitrotoga sp. BS TaxID=2890408 RepID=UPI001EF19F56|nr:diguanylate cyclase [Candidatus Nitrotoga sp. BS]CAH1194361.1 putative Diguanylate cyclase [Candidatus Nitrotoga sp. BS]
MVNAIFEELKAKDHLPSPKGLALKIIQLTLKEDVTTQEITHAIKTDPALSGRLIKMANVLMSYQTRPIASITDAVMSLGLSIVRNVVLGLSLVEGSRDGACRKFNYQNFWSQSLLVAIAAKNFIEGRRMGAAEEMFILGLLAQVGSLGLATAYPQEYSLILDKTAAGNTDTILIDLERTEFGLDHNQLTKEMLANWGLPQVFHIAALYHENPALSDLAEGNRNWHVLNILHIANRFAKTCLSHGQQRHKMLSQLMINAARLGLEADTFSELGDKTVQEWREWSKLFGIRSTEMPSFKEILQDTPPNELEILDDGAPEISLETCYPLRILLVEDDYATTMVLKLLLTKAGHTVATAGDGVEALSMLDKFMPQLIITDWHMPKMNGIEFCKALRCNELWRNIHVFVMLTQENLVRLEEIFKVGASDYLTKPVNSNVLGARLHVTQCMVQLQDELKVEHLQLRNIAAQLAASNQRLQQMALTDVLTELPNRRHANDYLEQQWAVAERSGRPLSCMMVDVDFFKKVNDTYGHKVGDDVLKQVAQILRSSARKQDLVCRFGGEEFLVICPDALADQIYPYAERLRQNVAMGDTQLGTRVTISIGVASKSSALLNAEMLLQLADKRLYKAKEMGRNITVWN